MNKIYEKIKRSLESYKRVLIACKKPSFEEFQRYLKVVIIGFAIIGLLGFLLYLVFAILRF